MSLSLFEIAADWATVSNEDVNRFKDAFYKEFPNAPVAPFGLIFYDADTPTYRLVYPTVRHAYIYRIDSSGRFEKLTRG